MWDYPDPHCCACGAFIGDEELLDIIRLTWLTNIRQGPRVQEHRDKSVDETLRMIWVLYF